MKKHILAVFVSSSVLVLTACGGGDGDSTSVIVDDGVPKNNIVNPVVRVESYTDIDSTVDTALSDASASKSLVTYKMLGVDGAEVDATTLVFTPKTVPPVNGWPIVVWAHGTTGVADKCAPSVLGLGQTAELIESLLDEGYVVVAPNYEGLGAPGNHPFLNLRSEAFSITDAVVAARKYLKDQLGKKVSDQWASIGHSQGGHAVLGAAQYASRAQLNYKGTVAIAPASNLASILTIGEQQASTLPINYQIQMLAQLDTYTALIVAGMQGHNKSVTYNEVFKNDTVILAPIAEAECSSTVGVQLGTAMSIYAAGNGQGTLTGYGRLQSGFMSIPVIDTFLKKESQPGLAPLNKKVFIYQGEADTTVPKAATDLLIASMKANGTSASNIQYTTSVAWDHGTVYTQNYESFVDNIDSLFQ
ncbi:MAG: triacylglycerol lipase [Pseudomonadales bacterium RIFCSPHIGHO2_12_FULL_40_16]|uniref:Triacylglycerol lipase n=1 Tax=Acinetobacter johnsonii TaxID=40214 RepID=A0A3S9AM17_ACIJO|nr:lipase family protein [Acinetobacter johnsonii]AZN64682.1 triacylglycerol lipase [Acinetobacter johnsonii]MCF7641508.1 alpha/beta hydrolase [Acinetobacter johnsonii]OFW72854.1 MAG: triacylglycerol lipase [Acinetobacter sp. RIFCSPHIGHO2_12_41_5]OHC23955.1 MAG: triacylglycerol lipase [Pseudomonadales bacterium RIFCSPHIGHO2_12_FULL_40_16]